jgi:long-chain acyl-CoA synthetase
MSDRQRENGADEAAAAAARRLTVPLSDVHARMTAPNAMFEMETILIDGRPTRSWKNGPKSLVDLWKGAARFGARTFLVLDDDRVSFEAFRRAAFAVATALIATGVRKGDRVAIAMPNQPEWVVAFYGAALAGAIATPINALLSADELIDVLRYARPRVLLCDERRYRRIGPRRATCAELEHVFVSDWDGVQPRDVRTLVDVIGAPSTWADLPPAGAPPVPILPEDDATLFFTSGTGGVLKGAVASHRAATIPVFASLFSHMRAFLRRGEPPPSMSMDGPERSYLLAIPLFHVTGCLAALGFHLAVGGKVVMMRKWDPETAMRLIERERIINIGGVPTIVLHLLEHPALTRYDLSIVTGVTYGGSPAPMTLACRVRELFPKADPGNGWGMTETSATFMHHLGEDYLARPGSCGPTIPVAEAKIVDPSGRPLPPGDIGELWVRGPNVMRRYWDRPEDTAAVFEDGWLKTGDIARIDQEGFCFIVDRKKDIIIRGGENVYSLEVETVLAIHPAVAEAALVPVPHPVLGEEVGAVVCLRPGADVSQKALTRFVAAQLAPFKVPTHMIFQADPLPRNVNGKVLKMPLRALFVTPR